MSKILVIAEKPSVGKDIARVLGCMGRGDGYLYSDNYIVTWAIGHLVSLCDPEDYNEAYKKWSTQLLPILPEQIKLKAIKNTRPQLTIIHKLINKEEVESLICATDAGREGELIFRYIYSITNCKKPFKRLWISSMTDKAIKDGFRNLRDGSEYDNLYKSAKCRSEADWLVGINATRAYTIKFSVLLSVGRVQTPTLAIIVSRQKEINNFKPVEYWELKGLFEEYSGVYFDPNAADKANESKIYDKQKAYELAEMLRGKSGIVLKIENEEKKQPPPLLYDLTELQRDANRRYGFSAQKTLGIAQDLYEKRKMITYPRTDSRYLSDDMIPKLEIIMGKLADTEKYKEYAEHVLSEKLKLGKRIIDNSKISDHHAIIPTEVNVNLNSLSGDELKIYDLLAIRFIAVFYPMYIYNVTRIVSQVEGENFLTKGTIISQAGWMELYKAANKDETKTENGQEEQSLPEVKQGDAVLLTDTSVMQKKTQPPKPYNEATLLSAMENAGRFVEDEDLREQMKDSGLGTPATRAAIIERLIAVGYLERKGKTLIATDKGMKLIDIVPPELRSPDTTGKWEKGLTSISKGKMGEEKFMGSIMRYVHYIVQTANQTQTDIRFPKDIPKENTVKSYSKNKSAYRKKNNGGSDE